MFLIFNEYHNYAKRKYIDGPQLQQYYYINYIKNIINILRNSSNSCRIGFLNVYKATPCLSFKQEKHCQSYLFFAV